jgi:azurin
MLRTFTLLFTALFAAAASAADVETFTIKTLQAQMRYDVTELTISPGANVKIIIENTDDMPHNLCFFLPGTDVVEVCNKQMEKPEEALKRNWLPEDPRLWQHSKMLNPKEKDEITFTAPDKPDVYPFVCSFPGHAMTMQGKLRIVAPGPKLTSLHFAMYLGDWKKLPDFAALQPFRQGELDGLVEIKLDDYKNQFGLVYTGKLKAPKDAEYTFYISGDDGVRVSIDGNKVVEYDGIHPAGDIKEGKVKLKAGEHDFRLEYFQAAGQAELYVAWSGGNFSLTPLSKWIHPNAKTAGPKKKEESFTGMPLAVEKEPVLYRNFITGAGNRSIAVGYPGGFNLAYNAEVMNLVLLWRGAFIDAARHWTNRGGGPQPPLGFDALQVQPDDALPFAVMSDANADWPKLPKGEHPRDFQWKGYTLDAKRVPTFHYEWNGVKVAERFDTEGSALEGSGKLVRTLQLSGTIPAGAMFCVASAGKVEATDGGFLVDGGRLTLGKTSYDNRFKVAVEGGTIASGKLLLVPAKPQIKITYTWLTSHGEHAQHAAVK